jgi:N6-L-threonylcarbamoyladenine synthase
MCKYSVILAFETSCDDTSIAVIKNGEVVSIATKSTLEMFKKFGGIIPEIASRGHEANIYSLTLEVLEKAAIKITDVNAVAYTAFPGLPGSLHVGKIFAKALAHLLNVKLVKIDHMMGHAFSYAINNSQDLAFPMLSLVISGGNTILYLFSSITKYKIINQTTDDAVGECLDKIGRYLGMEYPGGVSLDKSYNPDKATLKTIKHLPPETNFSFAGIKSFVNNFVNKNKGKVDTIEVGSSCLK